MLGFGGICAPIECIHATQIELTRHRFLVGYYHLEANYDAHGPVSEKEEEEEEEVGERYTANAGTMFRGSACSRPSPMLLQLQLHQLEFAASQV